MSHVVHENVEEYRTEDLNPLVSCLIPNSASLRYIFMILPLFLVLVPEASSDNMTEVRNVYDFILVPVIVDLERLINQNIKSSCNTSICYPYSLEVTKIPHQNAIITCVTRCLKIKTNCTKIYPELRDRMNSALELTTKMLNKNGSILQPHNQSQCSRQCKKNIRKCDFTHTFCCLKNVVSALSSWWKKYFIMLIPKGNKVKLL